MNMPKIKPHPIAAIFPPLPDDELAELADDIKRYGLINPIVMQDDLLIDGRNRLRACELAGVEPTFMTLAEDCDPIPYILSCNISRRHMSKGQRAMATAMVYPEAKMGRGSTDAKVANNLGLSSELVRQARTVLRCAPQLADDVLARKLSLPDAYETVKARSTNSGSPNKPGAGESKPSRRNLPTTEEPAATLVESDICPQCGKRLAEKFTFF